MSIIEIAAGVTALVALAGMAVTMIKFGRVAGTVEATLVAVKDELKEQKNDIKEQKFDIKELAKVLAEVAAQKQRMDSFSHMLTTLQEDMRDLRRGEGFVLPLEEAFRKKIVSP